MKKKLVVIGTGGHAKVVIDIIESVKKFKIVGLCDEIGAGEKVAGYKILGKQNDLPELIKKYSIDCVIVGICDNFTRSKVTSLIKETCPSLKFISAIHPNASIAKSVTIGKGSVITNGVIISPHSIVGESCILNTSSSLDHDSVVGSFSSFAPGVRTGGFCNIGDLTALGIGATLTHAINIGEETIIGAGSVVMKDVGSFVVAYGVPAKILRTRKTGDKYL